MLKKFLITIAAFVILTTYITPTYAQLFFNARTLLSDDEIEKIRRENEEELRGKYRTQAEIEEEKERVIAEKRASGNYSERELRLLAKDYDNESKYNSYEWAVKNSVKTKIDAKANETYSNSLHYYNLHCKQNNSSDKCKQLIKNMDDALNALSQTASGKTDKNFVETHRAELNQLTNGVNSATETPTAAEQTGTPTAAEQTAAPSASTQEQTANSEALPTSEQKTSNSSQKNNPPVSAGTQTKQAQASISGCNADFGLFSGLIAAGKTIFNGLRDLIYVVAGFGILGVAIGGFFGNMNWKWLGAICIALIIIATTGELLMVITGCQNYSSVIIQDTLR